MVCITTTNGARIRDHRLSELLDGREYSARTGQAGKGLGLFALGRFADFGHDTVGDRWFESSFAAADLLEDLDQVAGADQLEDMAIGAGGDGVKDGLVVGVGGQARWASALLNAPY